MSHDRDLGGEAPCWTHPTERRSSVQVDVPRERGGEIRPGTHGRRHLSVHGRPGPITIGSKTRDPD
jgi:hypothetical protein